MAYSLFHLISEAKGYPYSEAKLRLEKIHSMSANERKHWQDKGRWQIARWHYDHNPFYKEKVGAHFPDDWNDLPILKKADLQRPLKELLPKGFALNKCYSASTSGSSGTPFFFAKDKFTHALTWALISERYRKHGLHVHTAKCARFYGSEKEPMRHFRQAVKDWAMNRVRFSVFDLSDSALKKYTEAFKQHKFVYIYGYTSALLLFAKYLQSQGILLSELCPTLKLCISTSEICTPEDHIILKGAFGVNHIREYGISETCLTGFDMPDGRMLLTEETLYNEVVSDTCEPVNDNTVGNLLSTSLFNKAMPMIRYETGDRLQVRQEGTYKFIEKLHGRKNDIIILPDGKCAAGLTFYYVVKSILEPTGVIKEFSIKQHEVDKFSFDIVSGRELSEKEKETLYEKIAVYLQPGLQVQINRVEAIPRQASGKLKHFQSELQA